MGNRADQPAINQPNDVGVNGMLWSGSSAVIDLLTDTRQYLVFPGEFNFWRKYVLPRYAAVRSAREYRAGSKEVLLMAYGLFAHTDRNRLLEALVDSRRWSNVLSDLKKLSNDRGTAQDRSNYKKVKKAVDTQLKIEFGRRLRGARSCNNCNNNEVESIILEETAKLIAEVTQAFGAAKDKAMVFDQAADISRIKNQADFENTLSVLNISRIVVVYRDPADQFADVITKGNAENRQKKLYDKSLRFYEGDYVERFCRWQLDRLEHLTELKLANYDRILAINFEELVQNPNKIMSRLTNFANINSSDHQYNRFNPAVSNRNVGWHTSVLGANEIKTIGSYRPLFEEAWRALQ